MTETKPCSAPGNNTITPIERPSLHRIVAERVRDLMVDGTLPAGERINEVRLCGQLGVSRTPLREALKVLASEGLVELSRNRGAAVAVLSPAEFRDMTMLMGRLEAFAAEAAVARLDEAALAGLQAMHRAVLDAFERGNRHECFKLNQSFHLEIVRIAGNVALSPIHAALHVRMKRIRFLGNDVPGHWFESVHEHNTIMAAFEARDAQAAGLAARAHMGNAWENAWRRAAVVMDVRLEATELHGEKE